MAARHDIIHIDFQANAGKANAALQALQTESAKARNEVDRLRKELQNARNTNMPVDQIQKLELELKNAERSAKQWQSALQNNLKGVRALDEAVKQFNNGKGSVEGMSVALSKAARNAAQLQKDRSVSGSKEWKEMDALIVALDENILKANNDLKSLVQTIKNGGSASISTLTQAKRDLEQLLTLEVRGSKEWQTYDRQLKAVNSELSRLAEIEKKVAQANQITAMNKQMKSLKTLSASSLADTKRFWETMVAGAEKGSAELTRYEAKLKQVVNEEKRRTKASAETVLKDTSKYGVDQVRLATQQMTQLRDSMQSGSAMWQHYNKLVQQGETYLKEYADAEKIASGEAMSLADALKVASNAGGKGFSGTAKQLTQAEEALQKAAITAKKGSPEWQKYQEALAKVRVEMQNTGMTSERMRQILEKPANAKNLNELQAAVKRAKAELDVMSGTIGKNSKEYEELAQSTKKAEIQLKQLQGQAKGTASAFDKAWSRLKTYIGLYVGAAVAMQKLASTMGDIMELSDKMGEVRKTTGFTADEVGRLSQNLSKMDVRTPLVNLMEISASAGQLGLKTLEDVQGFTEAANKLMIALPEMGKEAATEMMRVAIATGEVEKIRKQLQEGTIEGSSATAVAMEKIASTIDRLRATSASTAPEITDFVKRVGAVGAQSGISIDQVSALGSTISSLGMRIEMSATALSRMIPAIKNNAFDIARAIGVTPNTIRDLFDAGKGMEVILMILQHMKDANMDEDSIEAMMGMGGMRDIMKDLNQQGARAGIVFAGLSQNVEELRRQLGVANQAYEENIAIEQEFQKMNATTAAKWERLKNQIEEAFVGDQSQRFLGRIIDGLRMIADFLSSNGPIASGVRYLLTMWAAVKIGIGQALLVKLPNAIISLTVLSGKFFTTAIAGLKALAWQLGIHNRAVAQGAIAWRDLNIAMKQNLLGAIIAALGLAVYKFWDFCEASKAAAAELGAFNQKLNDEKKALDSLFSPLEKSNLAQDERSRLITEINSKYSKYLGYMLNETNSAIQLADAHALIAKRIREEAYEKRILSQENDVRAEHNKEINEAYGTLGEKVRAGAKKNTDIQSVTDRLKAFADQNVNTEWRTFMGKAYDMINRLVADGEIAGKEANSIRVALSDYMKEARSQAQDIARATANTRADLRNTQRSIQGDINTSLNDLIGNLKNFGKSVVPAGIAAPQASGGQGSFLGKGWNNRTAGTVQHDWQGNANAQVSAEMPLPSWKPQINEQNIEQVKSFVQAQDQLRGYIEANAKNISKQAKATAQAYLVSEDELKRLRGLIPASAGGGGGRGGSTNGGWGEKQGAESTNYADMNAEQLVTRRKQMKDFVNAIQTDSDVKKVLAEDAALMKAFQGRNATMREVVEWYNTERLKIQEELHERHLTNTGDWLDPKQQKARKKRLQDELRAFLEELDAYYTERKAKIQDARNEEEISEAEAWRRDIANEAEWHRRRAELQKMYADKGAEVTKEEQDAILNIIAERTEDSTDFIQKTIDKTVKFSKQIRDANEQGAKEYRRFIGDLNLGWEKDFLKVRNAIGKQVKAIEDIVNKERPFNGIAENLQQNLVKIGALTADLQDEQRTAAEEARRMIFLLGEAEHAYSLTIDQLVEDMRKAGFDSWADAISKDDNLKRGLISLLHNTFDSVQEAIKKEAALIKKQVDIVWNDTLLPDGSSMKQNFENMISALGLQEDQVKRANQLIGAGQASERVADKLAIQQMKVRLQMQETYYNLIRKTGLERIEDLKKQAQLARKNNQLEEATRLELSAQHAARSLNLTLSEEQKKKEEQRVAIINQLEESQNRLYRELQEWNSLLASSMREMFEASHAGDAEYYNEMAKLQLTGKGGPGAGMYVIIDNEGTSEATAHYEYLDARQAIERQRDIEQQNAQAEAFRKVWDDINNKLSETITDQLNAMLQNASIDLNTTSTDLNTEALNNLSEQMAQGINVNGSGMDISAEKEQYYNNGVPVDQQGEGSMFGDISAEKEYYYSLANAKMEADNLATEAILSNQEKVKRGEKQTDQQMVRSSKASFAAMTAAANMYGIAYQAMSNENLSTTQKVEMMIVQAAGQAAMTMLTASLAASQGETAANAPSWISKTLKELGPIGGPVAVGVFTALIGGLMGLATSKIAKSKSQIAAVTGASVGAGRLSTGMLTYAEGNVNEFTDPSTLTPGRHYNVDAADGNTYRAKYMGRNVRTHITSGPEFHLAGEKGREAIIDAHTTSLMQMDDVGIWRSIQTLYNGGSVALRRRRSMKRGIPAFADGNLDEFEDVTDMTGSADMEGAGNIMQSLQSSLDRNSDVLERALAEGFRGVFDIYGKGGLVDSYDTGKKTLNRHGEKR